MKGFSHLWKKKTVKYYFYYGSMNVTVTIVCFVCPLVVYVYTKPKTPLSVLKSEQNTTRIEMTVNI